MNFRRVRGASILGVVFAGACAPDGPSLTQTAVATFPSTFDSSNSNGDDEDDEDSTASGPGTTPTSGATEVTTSGPTSVDPDTTANPTQATQTTQTTDPTQTTQTTDPTQTTQTTQTTDPTQATQTTQTTADTSASADTGPAPCDEGSDVVKATRADIMLVLDKSGSMTVDPGGYWDHDGNPNTSEITRWNSLHQVVELIVESHDHVRNFGANLFPSKAAISDYSEVACPVQSPVEAPVSPDNASAILAALPAANSTSLKGGTPTTRAIDQAVSHLASVAAGQPQYMVLITDGAANCQKNAPSNMALFEQYDAALLPTVAAALSNGVATYVVGIDIQDSLSNAAQDGNPNNINPFAKLNELAVAGGKPRGIPNEQFYAAYDQGVLQAALEAVIDDTRECVLALPQEPLVPDLLEVRVQNSVVPHVNSCASSGWVYTQPDGPFDEIELCGQACKNLDAVGEATVTRVCE